MRKNTETRISLIVFYPPIIFYTLNMELLGIWAFGLIFKTVQ